MKNNSQRIIVSIFVLILIMSAFSVSAILSKSVENQTLSTIECKTQGDIMPKAIEKLNKKQINPGKNSLVCSIQGDVKPPLPNKVKNDNNSGS